MISRTFKLCLNAGSGSAPYINVNQYDEGETWLFELYSENGERYIPSSGAIVGVKSDGHGIANTGTVDSEGRVVITETQQMTASAGRAIYELSIDGLTHGTANFIVAVERKPTDDAVMSDSDLSLIQEAIDSAEVIVDVIGDGDPSEVIGEHVDAWLDNHPEATTTVQDGAITAPKINQSLWDKLLVSEEASGAVASFDDGADDVPVSSLKVNLEPIQTGTGDPSPTNIRPISGHSSVTVDVVGKNLLPNVTETFGSRTYLGGTSNRDTHTLKAGTYTLSAKDITGRAPNGLYVSPDIKAVYDASTVTFTIDEEKVCYFYYYFADYTTVTHGAEWFQLEVGTEATEYEPFVSNSYPYSLGREVYGGTVDLATGVLTVDKAIIDIGSMDWATFSTPENHIYRSPLPTPAPKVPASTGTPANAISSCYTVMAYSPITANDHGKFAISDRRIVIINHDYSDVSAFTTAMTGQTICYELATPQTIQLTPTQAKTLLGYNNISSSGTVDVIYHADTKLYVDKMTEVDNNIIAPTEYTFTATRNYTVNDLVIVADTLYKVTANIASGSAITPNSNVTQTTLGALIKALS